MIKRAANLVISLRTAADSRVRAQAALALRPFIGDLQVRMALRLAVESDSSPLVRAAAQRSLGGALRGIEAARHDMRPRRSEEPHISEYTRLWRSQERALMQSPPARTLELDLNVSPPISWHFGPPPAGWGSYLAQNYGPRTRPRDSHPYLAGDQWGYQRYGVAALGALDPTRTPTETGVRVRVTWVQRQLDAKLSTTGGRLAIDGVLGPQTMNVLLLFIRDVLRQPVRSFDNRVRESMIRAMDELPEAYRFSLGTDDGLRSTTTIGLELERGLNAIPPRRSTDTWAPTPSETPTPETPSSGGLVLGALALLGVGLVLRYNRKR